MNVERAHRPRALWITDEPPDRGLGGGNIRQAHLVLGLGRVADVCLLVVGDLGDKQVRDSLAELIEVPAVKLPEPRRKFARRLFDLWIALGAKGPREVAITARRRRRLRELVAQIEPRFDLVIASHLGMAALLPPRRTARWVVQLHHVSSAKAAHEQALAPGRRQRWLLVREEAKAQHFERWLLRAYDACITVSDEDAVLLRALDGSPPPGRLLVAPNGVDTDQYGRSPLPRGHMIVMAGSFNYGPNVDGAVWFCDEVLPLVQSEVPDATLSLVGRDPSWEVKELAGRNGVSVHPDVPSMVPWFAQARLSVVPLRIGTGTRLKALESMAAGRPVVGTTIGLSGLGLVNRVHAHIVDDPTIMAQSIIELLVDDEHASALARAGRELVEGRFEWSGIADELSQRLLALAR